MPGYRQSAEAVELTALDHTTTTVLAPAEERAVLRELIECKSKLQQALDQLPESRLPDAVEGPLDWAQYVAATIADIGPDLGARLAAIAHRYTELRTRLALANLRLVAHMAKKYRDRGLPHADLMQEGFLGLLEAIDRFDLGHDTKLATYATWWIRQAMQRAVAAGAYPVRLSPRHLRQLAQNQEGLGSTSEATGTNSSRDLIQRIHTATRPALSLDASLDAESEFSLLQTMSDPDGDRTDEVDLTETIGKLMQTLRPREQEVLALRFGLGGQPRLSLSQVGQALSVSKERVRQIQDRALSKLRNVAAELGLAPDFASV